jgi:sigma-54 specific flagellar transcriptional regulator A
MPPLKDRADDIPVLIEDLVARMQSSNRGFIKLTPNALATLMGYEWPGNVRELANLIERLAIIYPGAQVDVDDLPEKFKVNRVDNADQMQIEEPVHENQNFAETMKVTAMIVENATQTTYEEMQALMAPREIDEFDNITQLPEEGIDLKEYLNTLELNLIRQALDECNGVVAHAAKRLGMRRTTLVEKLRKFDLSR